MDKKDILTRVLALVGTVLVWLPVLATVLISLAGSIRSGMFRFDYLMPAELFPLAFAGGGLLLWAALRARSRQVLIGGGLSAIVILLVGSQALAVATGLASGEIEPAGWAWVLVVAMIIAYSLAIIEIGVAGVLLVLDLFHPDQEGHGPALPAV
jgi:hypothetical protein